MRVVKYLPDPSKPDIGEDIVIDEGKLFALVNFGNGLLLLRVDHQKMTAVEAALYDVADRDIDVALPYERAKVIYMIGYQGQIFMFRWWRGIDSPGLINLTIPNTVQGQRELAIYVGKWEGKLIHYEADPSSIVLVAHKHIRDGVEATFEGEFINKDEKVLNN